MAKRKKRPAAADHVQFRPGPKLGAALADLALQENVSPGEMTKRLASMMVRCLPIELYQATAELAEQIGMGFDEAASQLSIHLELNPATKKPASSKSAKEREQQATHVDVLRHRAESLVNFYREIHEAEKKPIEIKLFQS
jgi:hypothetical protein